TGNVPTQNYRSLLLQRSIQRTSFTGFNINRINGNRMHLYQHLIGLKCGFGDFPHGKIFRSSGRIKYNRFHSTLLKCLKPLILIKITYPIVKSLLRKKKLVRGDFFSQENRINIRKQFSISTFVVPKNQQLMTKTKRYALQENIRTTRAGK